MSDPLSGGVDRCMERIEELVHAVEASSDPEGQAAARELTASLLALHEAGLQKVLVALAELRDLGAAGRAAIDKLAAEPAVTAMLALHELALPVPPRRAAAPQGEKLVQLRVPSRGPRGEPGGERRDAPGHEPRDRGRGGAAESPAQRCELCSVPVAEPHPHLLEVATERLCCACDACALLFDRSDREAARYRRVPRRIRRLDGLVMTEAQWDALGVPVRLAFFVRRASRGRVVALYPSPAGALESEVPEGAWAALVAANPVLADIEPDVEALLVHRIGTASDHLLAPIDRCFELTGRLRSHGGSIVWWARATRRAV